MGKQGKTKISLKNGFCHHRSAGCQSNPNFAKTVSVILASSTGIFNGTWCI